MKDFKINSIYDLKKEGKSFYWASLFLPYKSKKNAGELYSICRYFDNKADKDKTNQTSFLKNSITEIKNNNLNMIHIFFKKNNINLLILDDMFKGFIMDQNRKHIKNQKDLIKYSYYVAGTVGLMMSKIIGADKKSSSSSAIDLGIAMQMTNIARDVYEDAKMNRIYLPSDWVANLDINILNGKKNIEKFQEAKISQAIHRLINLSEEFYINGFAGLKYIPIKTRLAIFIAANIYRGIGLKIKKRGRMYVKNRVYLNYFEKTLITLRSILTFSFLSFSNYKYKKIRDVLPNENL